MKTIAVTFTTAQAQSILAAAPSAEVRQILEEQLAVPPKTCASCHGPLRNSLNPFHDASDVEMDNELWITFRGGYGSFIDTGFEPPIEVVLCHDCAIKMWTEFLPHLLPEHRNIECPCPGQAERTAAFRQKWEEQQAAWREQQDAAEREQQETSEQA